MIIEEISVLNYRSIREETLTFEDLTILIGPNGSGKSTFLQALNLFYNTVKSLTVNEEDFYNKDTSKPIRIIIKFYKLTEYELEEFAPYIDRGTLTIEKEIGFNGVTSQERYYGSKLQYPDFQEIRTAIQKSDKRTKYNELRSTPEFNTLPTVSSADGIEANLAAWEKEHLDKLRRIKDDGQFFGFRNVGVGKLERFTRFIFIPAVRDANLDATETKGNIITELLQLVVKKEIERKPELLAFKEETIKKYKELTNPEKLPELPKLQKELNDTLRKFVQSAGVVLNWQEKEDLEIPLPQAYVKLIEDNFEGDISKKGHGLQRAFIMTLLQHLSIARHVDDSQKEQAEEEAKDEEGERKGEIVEIRPNFILAIEEPELYQHPVRQRHISRVLLELAQPSPERDYEMQIIYSTHSPHFIGLDRVEKIRRARKNIAGGAIPETKVKKMNLDKITKELEEIFGKQKEGFTAASLKARLISLLTPYVNEGFFADAVVIVEGEADKAVLFGTLKNPGDLEGKGITVIPIGGKTNIDRCVLIFRELDIPVYFLFDGDKKCESSSKDCNTKYNRALLKLGGVTEEDFPTTRVEKLFACFEENLPAQLKKELSEEIYKICKAEVESLKIGEKQPYFLYQLMECAKSQKAGSKTLTDIISRIVSLADP
ncbi:MAG: DUF2813 domain-containing protein [Candidatus Omnitrophota bacterium]|jgi:predicted ATP-dependent endonuclease of OLD family|nr:MAG: DUF2813 domain-containing protein [Candidatus Omnitrophota bacterium]